MQDVITVTVSHAGRDHGHSQSVRAVAGSWLDGKRWRGVVLGGGGGLGGVRSVQKGLPIADVVAVGPGLVFEVPPRPAPSHPRSSPGCNDWSMRVSLMSRFSMGGR